MGSAEDSFSFLNLLDLTFWGDTLMRCKNVRKFSAADDSSYLFDRLNVSTLFESSRSWLLCFDDIDYLENIMHYLRLNVSFVEPNHYFDGTLGWYNETDSKGLMKMISNNEVDFIINSISMTDKLWHPNLFHMTNALKGDHKINFLIKKQRIKLSLDSYLTVFNSLIWLLMFLSILLISGMISLNLFLKKNYQQIYILNLNLIFDYLNMLICKQPSTLLTKLTSRYYLMYSIPILSIFTVNVIMSSLFSNMILPQQKWCQTLDCLAKSNIKFYILRQDNALGLIKNRDEWQFKAIRSRLQIQKERG